MASYAIYETKGKAREFCELASNVYNGCGNECRYCYVPEIYGGTEAGREKFRTPAPRRGYLENLEKAAYFYRNQGERRPVLLSFLTDPYQELDRQEKVTRYAIEILHHHDLNVNILTKCGGDPLRDFDLLRPGDIFSVTLTCVADNESTYFEPLAGLPGDRLAVLEEAHRLGLETWVSLEPVLNVDWTIEMIKQSIDFTGHYKVGKLNYYQPDQPIDWSAALRRISQYLDELGKDYYIKKDLAAYWGKPAGYWVHA